VRGKGIRVLVACEYSATVRDAFRARGFDAWSCDLLPTEGDPSYHWQKDCIDVATLSDHFGKWDLMIAHPPCTDLAVSGARHFPAKRADGRQQRALDFVQRLLNAPIPHIALENPVSIISSQIRKPDQIIQPWQFGHPETKTTCLWTKSLPKLIHTDVVEPDYMRKADGTYYQDKKGKRYSRIHFMSGRMKDAERWKERSRTYAGIAAAMASQWGDFLIGERDRQLSGEPELSWALL
jgi:site-specific DNA-cytosine methylase